MCGGHLSKEKWNQKIDSNELSFLLVPWIPALRIISPKYPFVVSRINWILSLTKIFIGNPQLLLVALTQRKFLPTLLVYFLLGGNEKKEQNQSGVIDWFSTEYLLLRLKWGNQFWYLDRSERVMPNCMFSCLREGFKCVLKCFMQKFPWFLWEL